MMMMIIFKHGKMMDGSILKLCTRPPRISVRNYFQDYRIQRFWIPEVKDTFYPLFIFWLFCPFILRFILLKYFPH